MEGLFSLRDKRVLVTGGAGGLGAAICEAMAINGAAVIVSDREDHRCREVSDHLCKMGYKAFPAPLDLASESGIEPFVEHVERMFGAIDVLVCNAGIQGPAGAMADITGEEWDRVMGINLKSAFRLCTCVLPRMAARGGGSVILMSSIAGLRGNKSIGLYGLSKAGLTQLVRNLAVEFGPKGIRVNSISPGLIRTPLASDLLENEDFMARRLRLTPLRRVGEPEEIAGATVFLASAAGGFVTGHNLVVDGGTTISDGN